MEVIMKEIILASNNAHKLKEFKEKLKKFKKIDDPYFIGVFSSWKKSLID